MTNPIRRRNRPGHSPSDGGTVPRLRGHRVVGVAVAGVGFSHFTSPGAFAGPARRLFPANRRRGIYLTGAVEMLCGTAMIVRSTRTVGVVAGIGYLSFLLGRLRRPVDVDGPS
jgi:uncharacterized membrane protein